MAKSKNRRRSPRSQRRAANRSLRKRVKKTFPGYITDNSAKDDIKMSEIFEQFMEPYRDFDETEDAFRKLITLSILSWNMMLFPKKDREAKLEELLTSFPEDIRREGHGIIEQMMSRKERLFSNYRRAILGYELMDTGDGWHLSIASTSSSVQG
jgi:hypothetical protein